MLFWLESSVIKTEFTPLFYRDTYLILLSIILVLFLIAFIIFQIISLFNNRFWSLSQMHSVYECGFLPFEEARVQFEPKFYMIALSSTIFDLEISFLFPWLLVFNQLNLFSLCLFFPPPPSILFGIIYEYKQGLFDWSIIIK